MTCADRELDIALYAGGDLPAEQAVEVERHLGGCPACQEVLAVYLENRAALADASPEVDEFAAAAVRRRVIAELRGRRTRLWPVFAAIAAAVLVTISVGAMWRMRQGPATLTYVPPAPPVEHVAVPHVPPVPVLDTARHIHPRVVPKAEREREEPILVKLETDDPTIVIYWITD